MPAPETRLVLEWQAASRPGLFPLMRAELAVYPLTSTETQLDFSGSYEAPLGLLGSAVFGGLILWTDFAGIRSLAMAEEDGWLAMGLLFFGLFVTFGSVTMGVAIMSYGRRPE